MAAAITLACITLLALILTPSKYRTLINPSIAFAGLWTMIVMLAGFRWLSMYPTSDEAYLIIVAGVASFVVGGFIASIFKHVNGFSYRPLYNGEVVIRYKLLMILDIICILYYVPSLIKSLSLMFNGVSLNDVRSLIQDSEYSSGLKNFIPNYVILPISTALETIAVVDFWKGNRNRIFISLTGVLVILRIIGDGGRTPLFNVVLYFVVLFSMIVKDKSESTRNRKKDRRIFIAIFTGGVLLLAVFTLMRAGKTAYRKLYFYFAMSPVLLTWWTNKINALGYVGHGAVSCNGILYFVDYIIKNMTGSEYEPFIINAYNLVAATDSTWIKIAPTTTANAYVSCFTFFYADGGWVGVILLSFLYGFILNRSFYNIEKFKGNACQIACYLMLFQGMFFSFIRFPFAKAYYIIALILVRFVAFKRSNDYKMKK